MKFLNRRFAVIALLLVCVFSLTGCLSHWFTDSSTRLQIENRTSHVFLGLDIISEDGSSVIPWIQDSLPPGERSRVFESDWVGTFNVQLKFAGWELYQYECGVIRQPHGYVLAKSSEEVVMDSQDSSNPVLCSVSTADTVSLKGEFEFVGGSVYMVLTDNDDGSVHMETR